jgi:hypothetical protein
MKAWIAACLPCLMIACGGAFTEQASQRQSDGGVETGGSNAGGSANNGGARQTGGRSAGGTSGPGGAIAAGGITSAGGGVIYPPGGATGAGGLVLPGGRAGTGGIDCSTVGCGAPPICGQACGAPCGCCPCGPGQHQQIGGADYVCSGGCWAPASSVDAGTPSCTHNGRTYAEGEKFRAGDGCNTCQCSNGGVGCTDMACTCDPASETHQREYVGTSPSQCAVLDFVCQQNTTMFQNSCGCGCEQSLTCPDWFDCMPGSGQSCDTNQIKTDCPYSGIAF